MIYKKDYLEKKILYLLIFSVYEVSYLWNVLSIKRPFFEIVISIKCPVYEIFHLLNVLCIYKMS